MVVIGYSLLFIKNKMYFLFHMRVLLSRDYPYFLITLPFSNRLLSFLSSVIIITANLLSLSEIQFLAVWFYFVYNLQFLFVYNL